MMIATVFLIELYVFDELFIRRVINKLIKGNSIKTSDAKDVNETSTNYLSWTLNKSVSHLNIYCR